KTSDKKGIFISHIHEEEIIANAIKQVLDQYLENEVNVFISEAIPIGANWFKSIHEKLKTADLLLVLFSPDSIERPWINIEAGYSIMSDKKVVSVCYLGLKQEDLPFAYSQLKGISIDKESDVRKLFTQVIGRELLEGKWALKAEDAVAAWQSAVLNAVAAYKNQRIINVRFEPPSYYQIYNDKSARCLDVFGWSKKSKAVIIGYKMHGGANQSWLLQQTDEVHYKMVCRHSNLCLAVNDERGIDNLFAQQSEWNGNGNQQWEITELPHGDYIITSRQYPEKSLTIEPNKDDQNTSRITLRTYGDESHQKWLFKITATVKPNFMNG
ncbi:MAG TPA: RICIN domain-containing protein, partial [Flavisolibacter sp.]|nr:RICIN domain-containing protein [Flavisolibacter sp.]